MKVFVLLFLIVAVPATAVSLYLLIRHFHRKWRWQDRVNANTITQASLDDATCEVLPDGQVRHSGILNDRTRGRTSRALNLKGD